MAVKFDEVDDVIVAPSTKWINWPATDWCLNFWFKIPTSVHTGNLFGYLFSAGVYNTDQHMAVFVNEQAHAQAGKIVIRWRGSTADEFNFTTPGTCIDDVLRLCTIQRKGNVCELYWTTVGGTPGLENSETDAAVTAIACDRDFHIGGRHDLDANRFYGGHLGDIFRYDASLSTGQIKALAAGVPPWSIGETLIGWLPMTDARSPQENLVDPAANATGTNIGTDSGFIIPQVGLL